MATPQRSFLKVVYLWMAKQPRLNKEWYLKQNCWRGAFRTVIKSRNFEGRREHWTVSILVRKEAGFCEEVVDRKHVRAPAASRVFPHQVRGQERPNARRAAAVLAHAALPRGAVLSQFSSGKESTERSWSNSMVGAM